MTSKTTFLLTSESIIKRKAVEDYLNKIFKDYELITISNSKWNLPPQPIKESTYYIAKQRINLVKKDFNQKNIDYIISVENGINPDICEDFCVVLIEHQDLLSEGISGKEKKVIFEPKYLEQISGELTFHNNSKKIFGFTKTVGEIIKEEFKTNNSDVIIDSANWMKVTNNIDRSEQIIEALDIAFLNLAKNIEIRENIKKKFKIYDDFKKGVIFEDMWPIFKDSKCLKDLVNLMANKYKYDDIDYIAGLEMRGVVLGVPLAYELDCGFIPLRKKNTLPGKVISESYEKEYGLDTIEVQTDVNEKSKILIIDDVLATGGSLNCAVNLIKKLNLELVDCMVLKQVLPLKEKADQKLSGLYSVILN